MGAVRVSERKHWGWGAAHEQPTSGELAALGEQLQGHLGLPVTGVEEPVPLEAVKLRAPRIEPPRELAGICDQGEHARAVHALGKAYRDVVRGFRGHFDDPPDVVAFPRGEDDVAALLSWCAGEDAAAIPFGGGTSVVGGIEPRTGERPSVTIDLSRMASLLEVDETSRAACIEAGALGPDLEDALRPYGLTLRHFPQSFQLSTLGGWIATRAGGHFATRYTHIDDLVESVRAVTPVGVWESRRLPGSGAGPSPDRMLIGSEGVLGVITKAWVRLQATPTHRSSTTVRFDGLMRGAQAVRALSQSGLEPSNCRLLDPLEARMTFAGDGSAALLVLGFESSDHEVGPWIDRALEICAQHGGQWEEVRGSGREGAAGAWRDAFLRAPYLRDAFVSLGVISETFESAITWDRFEAFHGAVTAAVEAALREVCGGGQVSCRFTHVYPDGPAPYFTVLAPARRGGEIEQWDAIKAAASDAIIAAGGTITHHHAVGRDHRPWYDRQRPEPFARALKAAKAELDPGSVLNPGVLV